MAFNLKIKYSLIALKDLDRIINYISESLSNQKAAKELFNKFVTSINDLTLFPESSQVLENEYVYKEIRKKTVDNYLVLYKIDYDNNLIHIIRIIYSKMNITEIIKKLDI